MPWKRPCNGFFYPSGAVSVAATSLSCDGWFRPMELPEAFCETHAPRASSSRTAISNNLLMSQSLIRKRYLFLAEFSNGSAASAVM